MSASSAAPVSSTVRSVLGGAALLLFLYLLILRSLNEDIMLTDAPPRKANRAGFLESDRMSALDLPQDGRLLAITKSVEEAMKAGSGADVRRTGAEFLAATSEFYRTPTCGIRVLAARPLRVRENWATELFGDYSPETMLIRVWLRTASTQGDGDETRAAQGAFLKELR